MTNPKLVSDLVEKIVDAAQCRGSISSGRWLKSDLGAIYIRYENRRHNSERRFFEILNLLNIQFYPEYQGHGYFREVLNALEKWATSVGVELRVGEIGNERLIGFLRRREGWELLHSAKAGEDFGWPTFVRRVDKGGLLHLSAEEKQAAERHRQFEVLPDIQDLRKQLFDGLITIPEFMAKVTCVAAQEGFSDLIV